MNKVLLVFIAVLIISCSRNNSNNNSVNRITEDVSIEEVNAQKIKDVSQSEDQINSPEMLDKVTYYHAELNETNNIKSNDLNESWKKIFIFTNENIQQFQKDLLGDDMSVSLTKDLNSDGIVDQVITGTYCDDNNNEGNFISIISGTKVMLVSKLLDQPTLLHFRAFDNVIYFGSGFASEYRKQITWKDNEFTVSDVLPD